MSAFTPCKGDFFHLRLKPVKRVIGDSLFGGPEQVARVIEHQDQSYSGDVFECVGRDSHMVVGLHRDGCALHAGRRVSFVIADATFFPVGPEVIEALGLARKPDAA